MKTIIAAFRDQAAADQAIAFLQSRGLSDIEVMSGESLGEQTIRKLRDLGVAEERVPLYEDIMQRGAPVVVARAGDDADELAMELDRLGSLDRDHVGARDTETSIASADVEATGEIDVIEEEVRVGKRDVERGGVRVRTYVAERPVREDVQLTEERIDVSRERVDEPISAAAADSTLREGDEEWVVTARGEEVVVGKEARVVERVHVGKSADTRTETVEETERRRDVEIEPVEASERDEDAGIGHPHR